MLLPSQCSMRPVVAAHVPRATGLAAQAGSTRRSLFRNTTWSVGRVFGVAAGAEAQVALVLVSHPGMVGRRWSWLPSSEPLSTRMTSKRSRGSRARRGRSGRRWCFPFQFSTMMLHRGSSSSARGSTGGTSRRRLGSARGLSRAGSQGQPCEAQVPPSGDVRSRRERVSAGRSSRGAARRSDPLHQHGRVQGISSPLPGVRSLGVSSGSAARTSCSSSGAPGPAPGAGGRSRAPPREHEEEVGTHGTVSTLGAPALASGPLGEDPLARSLRAMRARPAIAVLPVGGVSSTVFGHGRSPGT